MIVFGVLLPGSVHAQDSPPFAELQAEADRLQAEASRLETDLAARVIAHQAALQRVTDLHQQAAAMVAAVSTAQTTLTDLAARWSTTQATLTEKQTAIANAVARLRLEPPDVVGARRLLRGESLMPNPTIVAVAKTSGLGTGPTGRTITHGFSLQNGDILAAFVAHADDSTGVVSSSGGTWTNTVERATASGTDRVLAALYRVVTDAGSEPSSYTFTYSDTGNENGGVLLLQIRDGDTSTPLDGTSTGSTGNDDFTPDQVDITTGTNGALVIIAHLAVELDTVVTGKTAGAPGGFTIVDSFEASGGTGTEAFLEVASAIAASAGAQSIGVWTGTPDDAACDFITLAIAIKPGAGGQAAASVPAQSFTMMGVQ